MPFVLQAPQRPNFLDSLLKGAAESAPAAAEGYRQSVARDKLLQQQAQQARAAGAPEGVTDPALVKEFYKQNQKKELISQLLGSRSQASNQGEGQEISPRISDEMILAVAQVDPTLANLFQKQNEAAQKREDVLRTETLPIRKEISEKADLARRGIENKEKLLDLIEKGDINDPTYATLAEAIPLNLGKRLLSPDTVEYKAGLIEEFGDLRKLFQGQTRVKAIR